MEMEKESRPSKITKKTSSVKSKVAKTPTLKLVSANNEPPSAVKATPEEMKAIARAKQHSRLEKYAYFYKVKERLLAKVTAHMNVNHAYVSRENDVLIVSKEIDQRFEADKIRTSTIYRYRKRPSLIELYDNKLVRMPKFSNEQVDFEYQNPVRIWAKHPNRRTLKGIKNAPGQELPPEYLNIWSGWGTEPARLESGEIDYSGKSCKLILRHIKEVWANNKSELNNWILAWFSDILLNPTRKKGKAIMLKSGQGTGKGIILENVLAKIIGDAYSYETTTNFLTNQFNSRIAGKLLLFGDEIVFHGDKQTSDKLKAFVTSQIINIEEKGKDSYHVDHHTRLIAATNRNHAISLENDDRRWLILEVSEKYKGNHKYFNELIKEIENAGIEAFHAFLLNPELLEKADLASLPESNAVLDQKIRSLDHAESFIYECLNSRTIYLNHNSDNQEKWENDGFRIGKSDFHKLYLDYCKDKKGSYPLTDSYFSKKLQEILPLRDAPRSGGKPRAWQFPDIEEAREDFQKWIGCSPEPDFLSTLWEDYNPDFDCSNEYLDDDQIKSASYKKEITIAPDDREIPF